MAKSQSKDQKSLSEKVKSLFGFKESTPLNFDHIQTEPYHISDDLIKDASSKSPLPIRLKALKELGEIVTTKRLEDYIIEKLYVTTQDLTQAQNSTEARQTSLQFYTCIIEGQLENMTILRSVFFRVVLDHNVPEDATIRLELLKALSQNGKVTKYFEEEMGPFLLSWFPDILSSKNTTAFLPLVVNIIKHNAVYLDDEIVIGYIKYVYKHCAQTKIEGDIEMCLDVMDAVLCYSHLPSEALSHFVCALCFVVNKEKFSQIAWKLMRNLLGTSLGHNTILTMCNFLQNKQNQKAVTVLKGAIFFLGMALWGAKKVETLIHSPATVLPSFLMALEYNHVIVAYEISLSVSQLVKKNRKSLPVYIWEIILDIVEALLKYPELQRQQQPPSLFATCVHDLLTAIEESNVSYLNERLYHIIESCSDKRDESSVIRLINFHAQNINPMKIDFIPNLMHLLEKFFRNEKRQAVRLKVLQIVRNIRTTYDRCFEDDAMDQAILHHMSNLDVLSDVVVRKAAIEFLLEIAETYNTKRYSDILDIVDKVLQSHINSSHQGEDVNIGYRRKLHNIDIEAAVAGLIKIFEKKLYTLPQSYCTKVYNMLLNHITSQYSYLSYSESNVKIRRLIIDFFLKIRTNSKKQVGIFLNDKVEYSVYVLCSAKEIPMDVASYAPISPAPSSPNVFNFFPPVLCFKDMFEILIRSLKEEKDWITLELLFREFPKLLENKALVISGKCNISAICLTLYTLIVERCGPENLNNAPPRLTRTEFQSQIYPVIASLAAYHSELEYRYQSILIRCLQMGLVSRSARVCIEGLTLCTLEMRSMMVKHMPAVLLKLSQISATVMVSVAVLEFLSNLICLPPLYISFVEDQYRSIFAIALPYTNPYKFNQYTVALAHHVIAMWFLKCRIPFRKEFAKYITKSLRSNMSLPYDDDHSQVGIKTDSKDKSSNKTNDTTLTLHTELLELGLDLMARFTFGMTSNVPKRSAIADFLLEKGQKCSWIIGNKIVTITTSGCGTKSFKYGLCEKCYMSCREVCDSMGSDDSESNTATTPEPVEESVPEAGGRRRHRSAFNRQSTTLTEKLERSHSTKDDILLHRQRSRHFPRRNTSGGATTTVPEVIPDVDDNISIDSAEKSSPYQLCSCWCSGWAEIYTRRPTGNSSWMMKIQNHLLFPTSTSNIPLPAISSLLLPHKESKSDICSQKEVEKKPDSSTTSDEDEGESAINEEDTVNSSATSEALTCPKAKVQLRRTNSSPDMNSGWADYKKQLSLKKTMVQAAPMPEEQLPDNTNNAYIFPFEEDTTMKVKDQKAVQKSGSQKSKLTARFDLQFLKSSAKDIPANTQTAKNNQNEASNSFRDRGHTISVMSSSRTGVSGNKSASPKNKDMHRSGMNPSFVFLQLYHNSFLGSSMVKPYLIRQTEQNLRSLSVIDHTHPYDTHKIGVIYVGEGQLDDEQAILSNMYGSVRYVEFLRGLGNLVQLSEVDQEFTYVGGLDVKGYDGKYGLVWHDDVMRVAFHVATFMPNLKDDLQRNNKKTHIGNNFVTIVYNESGGQYKIGTIKSQLTRACVIIRPEDYNSNVVTTKVKTNELLEVFGHTEAYIVSDESLPIFVRQLALHANLASLILDPRQQSVHVSNWLARLRAIKRLRAKVIQELQPEGETSTPESQSSFFIDDFTNYV